MWLSFMKKETFEQKAEKIMLFSKTTSLDQIQNDDQNIDGIDCFHQHIQSLNSPRPLPGSTCHSVMLGRFDLYAVQFLMMVLFYISLLKVVVPKRGFSW